MNHQNIIILYVSESESNLLMNALSTCDSTFTPSPTNILDPLNAKKFNFDKDPMTYIIEYYQILNSKKKNKLTITKIPLDIFDKINIDTKKYFLNEIKKSNSTIFMLDTNLLDSFIQFKSNVCLINKITKINIIFNEFKGYYDRYIKMINANKMYTTNLSLCKIIVQSGTGTIFDIFKYILSAISPQMATTLTINESLFMTYSENISYEYILKLLFENHCYKINNYKEFIEKLNDNSLDYLTRCSKYDYVR